MVILTIHHLGSLIDFSHSLAMSEILSSKDVGGVRQYMAPEVLRMQKTHIGPASDIWSVGAVLTYWVCMLFVLYFILLLLFFLTTHF